MARQNERSEGWRGRVPCFSLLLIAANAPTRKHQTRMPKPRPLGSNEFALYTGPWWLTTINSNRACARLCMSHRGFNGTTADELARTAPNNDEWRAWRIILSRPHSFPFELLYVLSFTISSGGSKAVIILMELGCRHFEPGGIGANGCNEIKLLAGIAPWVGQPRIRRRNGPPPLRRAKSGCEISQHGSRKFD